MHLNKDEDDSLLSTPEYHTLTIDFEWKGEDMNKNECGYLSKLPLCPECVYIHMERVICFMCMFKGLVHPKLKIQSSYSPSGCFQASKRTRKHHKNMKCIACLHYKSFEDYTKALCEEQTEIYVIIHSMSC